MIPEAPLERRGEGLGPTGEGWYVLDLREARWFETKRFDHYAAVEGRDAPFGEVGVNVSVLLPGRPGCLYHREEAQEDFLVVSGEALLIVEGDEQPLRAWDFVHCPPGTNHVLVGAGDRPAVVVAVGRRPVDAITYPVDETARSHGASVEQETDSPQDAYAPFRDTVERSYRDGDLPELG